MNPNNNHILLVNQMAHADVDYNDMPYLMDDYIPDNIINEVNNHLQTRGHNPYVYVRRYYNGVLTLALAQHILHQ